MNQPSFSEAQYNIKKRKARREKLLEQLDILLPWKNMENKTRRHYTNPGNGRELYPLSAMLRIHCMNFFII